MRGNALTVAAVMALALAALLLDARLVVGQLHDILTAEFWGFAYVGIHLVCHVALGRRPTGFKRPRLESPGRPDGMRTQTLPRTGHVPRRSFVAPAAVVSK